MRLNDDSSWTFSPTDLATFTRCGHATQLRKRSRDGSLIPLAPPGKSIRAEMLARRGAEHEEEYLRRLQASGKTVVAISPDQPDRSAATLRAMHEGADVITQAALAGDSWSGYADFLERVETPSNLGAWSYEVVDAKLSLSVHPYFILQLGVYSDLVTTLQGSAPKRMHLILGDQSRHSFTCDDYAAYLRQIRRRFREGFDAEQATLPYPVEFCALCEWNTHCYRHLLQLDHLSLVAGIRRDHVKELERSGIGTLTALGETLPTLDEREIAAPILERLHHQARLQLEHRRTGEHRYELLAVEERRGFQLLPKRSAGDVFFDVEADPFEDLTYLMGFSYEKDGTAAYDALWSYDVQEERAQFERAVDFIVTQRRDFPDAHVYHYGPADVSTLKKLMGRHATRENEIDDLLRSDAFVDLLAVVRQSIRISQPSYSLKKVETFYFDRQSEGVIDAGGAIVAYEEWLESQDDTKRQEIIDYNREDCQSIVALRSWLLKLRKDLEDEGATLVWREPNAPEPTSEEREQERLETDELSRVLLRNLPTSRIERSDEEQARWTLAHLLHYHRREEKPRWWAFFERQNMSPEELIDDRESIGVLTPTGQTRSILKSIAIEFHFEPQQHKFDVGDTALNPHRLDDKGWPVRVGTVASIDDDNGLIELKRSAAFTDEPAPRAIVPGDRVNNTKLEAAVRRFAASILAAGFERTPYRAGRDILLRTFPRIRGHMTGAPLHEAHVDEGKLKEQAAALQESYLFIQGPPGSGKTYHGARIIVDLLRRGRRVGVTASSHKAIENMLHEVERVAFQQNFHFSGLKCSNEKAQMFVSRLGVPRINDTQEKFGRGEKPDPTDRGISLVAGTPWLFSDPDHERAFDDLVIDEAGQMSLANAIASSLAALNVILLGDPLQLAQVSQGSHPEGCGGSVLDHLLGDAATIPANRGVFLEQTRRMHADVCRFISDVVYESRLESHSSCNARRVDSYSLTGTGLRYHPIDHEGNTQRSREEANWVAQSIAATLSDGTFTDGNGTRALQPQDFMVVTPYNAQVTEVRAALQRRGLDVPVGTVDKFQGQEAPIVFFSMATSSGDDIPRTLDFLFSRNRLNVAVSRAQCLAILVASSRLLNVDCRTVEQMKLVNALCRFVEVATPTSF